MIQLTGTKLHNKLYDTYPCVVHAQGAIEHNPWWPIILKRVQNAPIQKPIPLNDLEIITYNSTHVREDGWNYPYKKLGNAEMSLNKLSVPFTVLGQNTTNWKNTLKPVLARQFLQNSKKKYVLSLDSSDVLVLQHPNKIVEFFKTQNCKILFNAEATPFSNMKGPIPDKWKQYEESLSQDLFRYLNAGVWIAETEYAIQFTTQCINLDMPKLIQDKQICPDAYHSEQSRVKCVFLNNPFAKLDYKCQVFQTILGMKLPPPILN
jgi:hypothetical protein